MSIAHKKICIRVRIVVINAICYTLIVLLKLGANLDNPACGSNEHKWWFSRH